MTGTIINTAAIVVGGICGHLFGRLLKKRHQETLTMACGVGTLFLGIAGAMNYMLHHDLLPGGGSMLFNLAMESKESLGASSTQRAILAS